MSTSRILLKYLPSFPSQYFRSNNKVPSVFESKSKTGIKWTVSSVKIILQHRILILHSFPLELTPTFPSGLWSRQQQSPAPWSPVGSSTFTLQLHQVYPITLSSLSRETTIPFPKHLLGVKMNLNQNHFLHLFLPPSLPPLIWSVYIYTLWSFIVTVKCICPSITFYTKDMSLKPLFKNPLFA